MKQYFTARDGGVPALLGQNGDIRCYGQIHEKKTNRTRQGTPYGRGPKVRLFS